jgi:mannitol/fructose-specific phosphotransferase system IIA component (Ntr-type)
MRTTGIGHGVAIPHGKNPGCGKLCLAIGKPAAPIDFAAVDGNPVDLIFLLASPPDQTGPHIQALANISRMLTDPALRQALRSAPTAADLYKLIDTHEAAIPV